MNIKRSTALGKLLLASCLMLALTAAFVTAAEEKYTRITMPMVEKETEFGQIAFALPSQMTVEGDVLQVLNYTGGRVIKAAVFINESKVTLNLLYPCQAPQKLLEPAELRMLIESYDPVIKEANYSEELLGISGLPAIWGMTEGNIFAAYQPTNQTAALLIMDVAMGEKTMADLLGNFSVTLNEGITPLLPGSCPDTTTEDGAAEEVTAAEQTAATGAETESTAAAAVSTEAKPATGKEKMSTDIDAARKRIEELRKGR